MNDLLIFIIFSGFTLTFPDKRLPDQGFSGFTPTFPEKRLSDQGFSGFTPIFPDKLTLIFRLSMRALRFCIRSIVYTVAPNSLSHNVLFKMGRPKWDYLFCMSL